MSPAATLRLDWMNRLDDSSRESPSPLGPSLPREAQSTDDGVRWMQAFQAGDASAFDRIVAAYRASVQHFIGSKLTDDGRAEDLTQEVFVRVYRARARYEPTAQLRTWLFTIANRLVLNEIRAIRRRRRVLADPGAGTSAQDEDDGSFWGSVEDVRSASPGEQAEQRELEAVVERLIAALPDNQRAALQLQRLEALSYAEIAEILQVTPLAVKALLVRAREKLKIGLEQYRLAARSAGEAPNV